MVHRQILAFWVAMTLATAGVYSQTATDANGLLLAQNPAVEQSRLFQTTAPPNPSVNADGMPLPEAAGPKANDESFGAQQILKAQQQVREFVLSGDASIFYTNNVALTRRDTVSDSFFVGNAGLSWNHAIDSQLQVQIGGHASLFRYFDTSALDFENLGAGIGFTWVPQPAWGIGIFARYDFTELLDKHSRELLEDHEFTLGVQKVFAFNRVHAFTVGALASAGISDPFAEQRDQIAAFAGYHVFLTRQLDADIGYRIAGFFYNKGGRDDFAQGLSLGLRYHFTSWMEANALLALAMNRSTKSVFDYDVLNTGGSIAFTLRF
jgi:hypothetical protein